MLNRVNLLLATMMVVALVAAPVSSQTWNYSNDFSITTNPLGEWHYGWLNSDFSAFGYCNEFNQLNFSGCDYAFWITPAEGAPCCGKVIGPGAVDYEAGEGYPGAYLPVGGYLGSPNSGNSPSARWVSSVAARLQVSATFKGAAWTDTGSNSDVWLLKNRNVASPVFSGHVEGYYGGGSHPVVGTNHTASYVGEVIVNPGDTLDFAASNPVTPVRTFRDQLAFDATVQVLEIFTTPTLNGTVTDQETGDPVVGAKVKVVGGVLEAVTNELGVYTLQLAPDTYSLEVSATWYQTQTVTNVVVTSSGSTQNVTLTRIPVAATSWSYTGDFDYNANPTPSQSLPVWTYGRWSTDLATFSLHDYMALALGASFWQMNDGQATSDGKMYTNYDDGTAYVAGGTACLAPGLESLKAGARWTSPKSGSVWVHAVFRGQGYAVPTYADVHVIKNCGTAGAYEYFTDTVSGFVGGDGHDPIVDHAISGWWGLVDVTYGDTIDFIVGDGGDGPTGDMVSLDGGMEMCQATGTVAGTVYDASHQPITGATVQVLNRSEFAVTDGTGHYSIEAPSGTYTLAVSVPGVGGDQKSVTLTDSQTVTQDFNLGTGTVQGTVREAESSHRPLMGAVVKVVGHSETAVTDETGHYSIVIGAGSYSIEASADGRVTQTLPATVTSNGSTTVNFDLALLSTWSYGADFNVASNPNGAWHYGWLNSDFSLFTYCSSPLEASFSGVQYIFWIDSAIVGNPCWGKVLGPGAMDYPAGPGYSGAYLPGGYIGSPNNANSPAASWVSPIAGRVQVSATFMGGLWSGTGSNSDVRVLSNRNTASPLFSGHVGGFPGGGTHPVIGTEHTATYSGEVTVNSGDTIDFVVVDPGNRNFGRDQLQFAATVSVLERVATVSVSGTLTDNVTGLPVSGATVSLTGGESSLEVTTGLTGKYVFYVVPGTYTIRAYGLAEYTPQSYDVTVTSSGLVHDFSLVKATQWSLAGDWSSTQNPNASWTYGSYDYYMTTFTADTNVVPYYGAYIWSPTNTNAQVIGLPKSAGDIDDDYDFYPAGSVTLFPATDGTRSGARWTAPYATTVRVAAVWSGPAIQPAESSSDVQIWKNGCAPLAEYLQYNFTNGFAGGNGHPATGAYPTIVWSGLVTVAKGETLDFSAGWPDGIVDRLATPARLDAWIAVTGSETPATRLSALKGMADGQFVVITDPKVVTVGTGTFSDGTCYIEDTDRVSGIKIILATGLIVTAGDRVKVEGVVGTDPNGERTLFVSAITSQQTGSQIGPLGAPNKSIRTTVTGAGLASLLVTGWGRVTDKSETGQVIYLDDGSGVVGEGGKTGIKVVLNDTTWPSLISVDDKVTVKGVCAMTKVGGVTYPVILARDADDVTRP